MGHFYYRDAGFKRNTAYRAYFLAQSAQYYKIAVLYQICIYGKSVSAEKKERRAYENNAECLYQPGIHP